MENMDIELVICYEIARETLTVSDTNIDHPKSFILNEMKQLWKGIRLTENVI